MKTPILAVVLMSCLLTSAVAVLAQEPAKPEMKMHNMMGCLTKTDSNSYLIMNSDPKGPKTIGVVSSTADLAPHVGEKIEITGVEVPMKDAEAMKNVPKAEHYMKISKVKKLAGTCPAN
jgi:hypothetical protein